MPIQLTTKTAAELDARAGRIEALEELCHHLRHCRECGDVDVMHCDEGEPLWLACFPKEPVKRWSITRHEGSRS